MCKAAQGENATNSSTPRTALTAQVVLTAHVAACYANMERWGANKTIWRHDIFIFISPIDAVNVSAVVLETL